MMIDDYSIRGVWVPNLVVKLQCCP